jgi:hypothetical protein
MGADRSHLQLMRPASAKPSGSLGAPRRRSVEAVAPPIVHEALRSPGEPLDAGTRGVMEARFGHDFSRVRIHAGARAAESAEAVNSLAYTVGQQVVFGASQYAPQTARGSALLAHELTHTMQQPSAAASGTVRIEPAGSSFERAADARATGNAGAALAPLGRVALQRQPKPAASDDRVAVSRVENDDGTWSSLNSRGEVLDTGPLGPVIDPRLPDKYSTVVFGGLDEAARKAALRKYADPAWTDPISPVKKPESYDPQIYDIEVLRRKAAERKFDEYDRQEYGAHGVLYKRRGSGRVYAHDIKAEDYQELVPRYHINFSTDPDRVVLPHGYYGYESVYEGKLLKQTMAKEKQPPQAIHKVAARLFAESQSLGFLATGIASVRFPIPLRSAPRTPPPPAPQPPGGAPGGTTPPVTSPPTPDVRLSPPVAGFARPQQPAPPPPVPDVLKPSRPVAGFARPLQPAPAPVPVPPGGATSTRMPPARNVSGTGPTYGNVAGTGQTPVQTPAPATPARPPIGFRKPPKDVADPPGFIQSEVNPRQYVRAEHFGDVGAGGQPVSRYHVNIKLDKNGMMDADFSLREGGRRSGSLYGKQEFMDAKAHFERHHGASGVRGVHGRWSSGDNLDTFNARFNQWKSRGLSDKAAMREAAKSTKTGEWAREAGFKDVNVTKAEGPPGAFRDVEVQFTR